LALPASLSAFAQLPIEADPTVRSVAEGLVGGGPAPTEEERLAFPSRNLPTFMIDEVDVSFHLEGSVEADGDLDIAHGFFPF
jgi:hypothetical protein